MSLPWVFRFNADFEYALADGPGYRQTSKLAQLMSTRATAMRLLAWDEPVVLRAGGQQTSVPLPAWGCDAVWSPLSSRGQELEGKVRYRPWGVTDATRAEASRLDPGLILPETAVVRQVQGRCFSLEQEQALGLCLPGACVITSEAMLWEVLPDIGQWVLKHPFGVAGRERQRLPQGRRSMTPSVLGWVRKVLERHPLILEPWMDRVRDWSVQLELPQPGMGPPMLLGVLEQRVLSSGTWAGHRLGLNAPPDGLVSVSLQVAAAAQAVGYWGPLGLDAFEYRDSEGQIRLRPLVELNARHTMGMCALAVASLTRTQGVWEWQQLERRGSGEPWPLETWRQERADLGLSHDPNHLRFICGNGANAETSTWGLFVWEG